MRDHSAHIELSRDEAVAGMLAALPSEYSAKSFLSEAAEPAKGRIERVALTEAYGRVLARDVRVKTDLPNVLTCALDSIAVHWDDIAALPEGELPDTAKWVRGFDWEFANTGVAMPEGFDTAIVIEHVQVSDDEQHVTIDAVPSERYAGTRAVGSSRKRGDVAAKAGALITADVAAAIASAGAASVEVVRRPRVAFIPTGDELVPANLPFSTAAPQRYAGYGHVFESNSAVVQGKVEKWGGVFVPFDIVPDEREAIEEAVRRACATADIVVLNAGSSKGSDDWSVEVLEELGTIICHQTNHGPGHHSSYALVEGVPIVGISGPAGGASFTLDFYLRPVMREFLGLDSAPERIPAVLNGTFANNFKRKGGTAPAKAEQLPGEKKPAEATEPGSKFCSIRFVMVEVSPTGVVTATPVPGHPGSPETQHANAFYMMPSGPDDEPPAQGSVIHVEMRS